MEHKHEVVAANRAGAQRQASVDASAATATVSPDDVMQSAQKLAPFTPSGNGVLTFAMELLQLTAQDVLYDLGCGDARILVHAAETSGARCAHTCGLHRCRCVSELMT